MINLKGKKERICPMPSHNYSFSPMEGSTIAHLRRKYYGPSLYRSLYVQCGSPLQREIRRPLVSEGVLLCVHRVLGSVVAVRLGCR